MTTPEETTQKDAYVVGWEHRGGKTGGNEVVRCQSAREARRQVRRQHGRWTTRITSIQRVP